MQVIPGKTNTKVASDLGVTRDTVARWPQNRPQLVSKLQQAYAMEDGEAMTKKSFCYRYALSEMIRLEGMTQPQIVNEINTKPYRREQRDKLYKEAENMWKRCIELGYIAGLAGGVA